MINTVTLNPAADKVFFIDEFKRNSTNRIKDCRDAIGGKGTHVSINLKLLGMDSRAFGVCYGETGKRILEIQSGYGLKPSFVYRKEGNSRTNYVVIENCGASTLITERGMPFTEDDFSDLMSLMQKEINSGDFLVIAGDASNADPAINGRIIRGLEEKKLKVFLDTSGAALKECAGLEPFLLKPNLEELSFLCGRKITEQTDDVIEAVKSLSHYRISVIAVSLGKEGSILYAKEGIYKAEAPLVKAVNTTGCGDCFLAGLVYGYANELSIEETLRIAAGSSAAKAEWPLSEGFDPAKLKGFAEQTKVKKIG
jgi:1-phosphofructokinase family hexose kinase